jgi:outer membrane receptor protein involved in Fe transport
LKALRQSALILACASVFAELAFAQAPEPSNAQSPSPPSTPATTTPSTSPPAAETPAPSPTPGTSNPLPQININIAKPPANPKPSATDRSAGQPARIAPPGPRRQARPAQPAQPSRSAQTAQSAPPSGAPNVGAGPQAPPNLASQISVSGDDLNARPVTRPGEIVEAAPGLSVTQHSGEGKANQYFLRGFNLDHGTDIAISVDDMPINLRTHAHGQGYADLNFLMPEAVNALDIRKGPFFADVGDFGNAGSLAISLRDTAPRTAGFSTGSFGYERLFEIGSAKVFEGNVLVAAEAATYNGPWVNPDDMRKFSGMMRYSQGTATDGVSLTAMAYSNKWNSSDQVPLRAIASGAISLYGELDPYDGGDTTRFSLSGRLAQSDDLGSWKANFYAIKYTLDLYNNFEWDTPNVEATVPQYPCGNALPPNVGGQSGCPPLYGDQFHQRDDRVYAGGSASRTYQYSYAGMPTETTFGVQTRYDAISLGLTDTYQRTFLANIRSDNVGEGSVGIYGENTIHWTKWFRTTLGWRGDYFEGTDSSIYDALNSGRTHATIGSPKATMVLGPFDKTEFFLGAGMGYHSNDVRGTTITEYPVDRLANPAIQSSPLGADPLLVRTRGAEVGVRSKVVPGLDTSVSAFFLDQASELVFDGDIGQTEAGRASERYGVEFTNDYRPTSWVHIDANLALSHARFLGYDFDQANLYQSLLAYPAVALGNAPGNYIPNSPWLIASAGVTVGEKTGWFGALRWRYLGTTPLTEDNAFRSSPTSMFNARLGYTFDNGWKVQLDALNLFDAKANQIMYAYGSLIKSDPLYAQCISKTPPPLAVCQTGVTDFAIHPTEPLAVRLAVTGIF